MIDIKRERFCIVTDDNRIFCGLSRNHFIKDIDNIGDTPIKTYSSEQKAKTSFLSSWMGSDEKEDFEAGKYKVVKVVESISEIKSKWKLEKHLGLDILYCENCNSSINCNQFGEYYLSKWRFCPYCGVPMEVMDNDN